MFFRDPLAQRATRKGRWTRPEASFPPERSASGLSTRQGMAAKAKSVREPAMKAYALPKDDLDALVAYMMTLKAPKK